MKKSLWIFVIFLSVLPINSNRVLPHSGRGVSAMRVFLSLPLRLREKTETKDLFENLVLRKTANKIPVYIITSKRKMASDTEMTGAKLAPKLETKPVLPAQIFDENGMIFLTAPKNVAKLNIKDLHKNYRRKSSFKTKVHQVNNMLNNRLYRLLRREKPKTSYRFSDLVS